MITPAESFFSGYFDFDSVMEHNGWNIYVPE